MKIEYREGHVMNYAQQALQEAVLAKWAEQTKQHPLAPLSPAKELLAEIDATLAAVREAQQPEPEPEPEPRDPWANLDGMLSESLSDFCARTESAAII